jgi:phospholipase/carboxylesterase
MSDFIHRFEPGRSQLAPLLLLHGTGGDENDLLPLGPMVAPGASLLSPRGQVLENGMPRFFQRLSEGVFDEDDVRHRAAELANFVTKARANYGLDKPIALGFSNGANIAAAMLVLAPDCLAGAILLRAMVPLRSMPQADLQSVPVLIVSGTADPIIPAANATRLADALRTSHASVTHEMLPTGHQLTQNDIVLARDWYRAHFGA